MTPARWQQIKDIFDSALDVSSAARASFLASACPHDPELREEVERLLHQHDTAGDFLEQPIVQAASLTEGEMVSKRYRIGKLLGRGGMGEVYEAYDQLLNETVALKTLRTDLSRSDLIVRRFQREIQLARKVTHPNVCRVFEVGVHEPELGEPVRFFTMDLLRGETLASRLRHKGKLTRDEAFPLAAQMAEGLHAAHSAGIVHTDFKSGNVILTPGPQGERAVITDFGLARTAPALSPLGETATMSAFGQVAGTVAYMSPEQLSGGVITPASDIYSFGIVLFEMATGKLPFDDRHLIQSAMQRASGQVDVRSLAPQIDQRWEGAILRCLQKDPKKRFASAAELAGWFEERGGWPASYKYWTRRDWIRAGAAAAGVAAVGGGSWYELTRPYQPKPQAMEWYRKGEAALHAMTYEAARKALEQAIAADPQFALARASLGHAYTELDDSDRAQESMLAAVSAAQESRLSRADELRLRAEQYFIARDYERARPLFLRLEEEATASNKAMAVLASGQVEDRRGKTDLALAAYERAAKLDPNYAAALMGVGMINARKQQTRAALAAFDEAERLYTAASDYEGASETVLERGKFLNRISQQTSALPSVTKAIETARTTGNAYQEVRLQLLEGVLYRNLGDVERARQVAESAVQTATLNGMESAAASGLVDLGNTFFAKGEPEAAGKYVRQSLEFASRRKNRYAEARARLTLGSMSVQYDRNQDAAELIPPALAYFRQAGYRRETTQALMALGQTRRKLAEYDQALPLLQEAVTYAASNDDQELLAQAHGALGNILEYQGAFPKALSEFDQSVRMHKSLLGIALESSNAAAVQAHLGLEAAALVRFRYVEDLLAKTPALERQVRTGFLKGKAELALNFGRVGEALGLARKAGQATGPNSAGSWDAKLLEGVCLIRSGNASAGAGLCLSLIADHGTHERPRELAAAQLAFAEAASASALPAPAWENARGAVAFFEARKIWEAVWRCHYVASQSARDSGETRRHRESARRAFAELHAAWGAQAASDYLKQPRFSGAANFIV